MAHKVKKEWWHTPVTTVLKLLLDPFGMDDIATTCEFPGCEVGLSKFNKKHVKCPRCKGVFCSVHSTETETQAGSYGYCLNCTQNDPLVRTTYEEQYGKEFDYDELIGEADSFIEEFGIGHNNIWG